MTQLMQIVFTILLVLVVVLGGAFGGSALHAATAGGTAGNEWITFETLSSNTTTGRARLDQPYENSFYEFSLTGSADKGVHIKHRVGNTSRFTNATVNTIKLSANKWWKHRVRILNDSVQEAKIQCVSGCANGETVTARGTYIQ